jgi:transcriptional regulator with XRE-family HTH domain
MEKARAGDESSATCRRTELGDFLRSRRASLTPEAVGLPSGVRRRTPGLRREEVAELADLSVALYTWLEQGRDVPVSRRAIDAIAHALRLTPGEHRHLHVLAAQEEIELREEISPSLRRMVLSFRRTPVFVLDHAWDIVLRNVAAVTVFGGMPGIDTRSNMLEQVFEGDAFRSLFVEYDEIAAGLIAMFRLEFPSHAEEPRSAALVEGLRSSNPLFEELWQRYNVKEHPQGTRILNHPVTGALAFEPSLLGVVESPGLRMMLYTPANDETSVKVERLVADYTASAGSDEIAPSSKEIVRLA